MRKRVLAFTAASALIFGSLGTETASAKAHFRRAVLTTAQGNRIGSVWFVDVGRHSEVRVSLNTGGLTDVEVDVFHAFHIHANNDPANGSGCLADVTSAPTTWFTAVDGHWNPTGQTHGLHVGDMPVLYFNSDGGVEARFRLDQIKPRDVAGMAVVLHAGLDNFGNIPLGDAATQYKANGAEATTLTDATGNAGVRVACGLIR